MNLVDFKEVKKVYLIGIKGSGMASLAEIILNMGKSVVGSDVEERFFTDQILSKLGIEYYEGFSADNLEAEQDVDLVVFSSAYSEKNNVEMKAAVRMGIPMVSYSDMVAEVFNSKFGIAVCGTHGKTTTTAMLSLALRDAGKNPTALVGSKMNQTGTGALVGTSEYFVLEADEYQGKILKYHPYGAILTSVDFDHPDYFSDFDEYKKIFRDFVRSIPAQGFLVAWGENADVVEIAKEAKCRVVFYGFFGNEHEDPSEAAMQGLVEDFYLATKRRPEIVSVPRDLRLKMPGRHNLLDATAALAVCLQLGVGSELIKESLENFSGTARRFEIVGNKNGALIIDDYAHHPEEVRATLSGARAKYYDKNIICVFHPHTFSRTQALLDQFAQSFDGCDKLYVLDIYGSAREKQGTVSSKDLVDKINVYRPGTAEHVPTMEAVHDILKENLGGNDILITMGAGNVFELAHHLVDDIKKH